MTNSVYSNFLRLLVAGADPLSKDVDGLTPSHYAAIAGNVETLAEFPVKFLSVSDNVGSRFPIHLAAICGNMGVIEYILAQDGELFPVIHFFSWQIFYKIRAKCLKSSVEHPQRLRNTLFIYNFNSKHTY